MDRNTPEPLGSEEGKQAAQTPAERQYDPELGKRAARDAQRVVAGELSQAEFLEKHHEAYVKEFGFDNRAVDGGVPAAKAPDESAKATEKGSATKLNTSGPVSRRAFLMASGGVAAAVAISASLGRTIIGAGTDSAHSAVANSPAHGAGGESATGKPVQMGMVIDLERCTGCLACVDACHRENNLPAGTHWIYVVAYEDEDQEGVKFLARPCNHCTNAPCVKVCPTMARHKRQKDGLVLTDYDVCIGTRYCQVACPYGVNYFQWDEPPPDEGFRHSRKDYRGRTVDGNPPRGVMGKCTFCPQRQDSEFKRGTTACQQACPHDAIFFGDMNDPNSAPQRYLAQKRAEKGGDIATFRLLEELGTQPNILFIGHKPSKHAKQVDGPTTYADWGFVDERGDLLEGPRPWFLRIFGG